MIRSLIGVLILFVAMFYMPIWAQIILFVGAVFLLPHRWLFLIPAVFYDVLYSPTSSFSLFNSFANFKMTIVVLLCVVVCELIVRNMRVGEQV